MTSALWVLWLVLAASPAESCATPAASPAVCCYARPGFAGGCRVTPAEGESCASILRYLNDPHGVGKTYCGSTDLRGGWRAVRCAATSASGDGTAPAEVLR